MREQQLHLYSIKFDYLQMNPDGFLFSTFFILFILDGFIISKGKRRFLISYYFVVYLSDRLF